jgi:hypothetical protein
LHEVSYVERSMSTHDGPPDELVLVPPLDELLEPPPLEELLDGPPLDEPPVAPLELPELPIPSVRPPQASSRQTANATLDRTGDLMIIRRSWVHCPG